MQQASFDFSSLEIKLVDQKEEYVNDEPKDLEEKLKKINVNSAGTKFQS